MWPHNGAYLQGSYDARLGVTQLPETLRGSMDRFEVKFSLEQPEEDTNLTVLTIVFHPKGRTPILPGKGPYHNMKVRSWRAVPPQENLTEEEVKAWRNLKPAYINFGIKGRYVKQLKHPMPVGQWSGSVNEADGQVVYYLSHVTHKKVAKRVEETKPERTILIPGDEGFSLEPRRNQV